EPILDVNAKAEKTREMQAHLNIHHNDIIAVGDGANDIAMLQYAGIGVTFHAKPAVAEQAKYRIDHCDLTALLYMQGYKQSEFVSP
ncbi:MAG: HAD hydrolase family protein, partial [Alphaproteobacteria bacterium]|nr:HAD hydrolase family protein [Alphaproteobacteria bacterium]